MVFICCYGEGLKRSGAGGMSGKFWEFRPPLAGFSRWTCQTPTYTKSFWGSMWSTCLRGHILVKKKSFSGFSAGSHCQDHQAFVGGILAQRIGRHIRPTGTCWTSLSSLYCRRKSRLSGLHMSIYRYGMWPVGSRINPQDLSLIPLLPFNHRW
jgi:hypothetical protein